MTESENTILATRAKAEELLILAGFEKKYQTPNGASSYFHLSGYSGLLRVSDHPRKCGWTKLDNPRPPIRANLTIHAGCLPRTDDKLERVVGATIGMYLIRASQNKEGWT